MRFLNLFLFVLLVDCLLVCADAGKDEADPNQENSQNACSNILSYVLSFPETTQLRLRQLLAIYLFCFSYHGSGISPPLGIMSYFEC